MKAQTTKQMLLKGVRQGDFAALLALRDLAEEEPNPKLLKILTHMLETAEWHTITRKTFARRGGISENLRRWFRDDLWAIHRLEKCWRLPQTVFKLSQGSHPMNRDEKLYEWQMTLARAALAYYRSLPDA